MATLGSPGLMLVSEPSTVTAFSGKLEKWYQQAVTLSGLGWSETTLSISAFAGTNLAHRSLMASCIAELTPGLIQMSDYGSTVNCIAQQVYAEIGGANASITYVAISLTGAASGNDGVAAVDAVGACDQRPGRMGQCDIRTRRARPKNWEPAVQIR